MRSPLTHSQQIRRILKHRSNEVPEIKSQTPSGADTPATPEPIPIDKTASGQGIVILKDKPVVRGRILSLTGDTLIVEGPDKRSLPFKRSELVGLDFEAHQLATPPRLPGSAPKVGDDIIVRYDGSMIFAKIGAITNNTVITDQSTLLRKDVDRIVFHSKAATGTLAAAEPPNGVDVGDPSSSGVADNDDTSGQDQPTPSELATAICPKDKPLGGWAKWRYKTNYPPVSLTGNVIERINGWFTFTGTVKEDPLTGIRLAASGYFTSDNLHLDVFRPASRSKYQTLTCTQDTVRWSGQPVLDNYYPGVGVLFNPVMPDLIIGFHWENPTIPEQCTESISGSSWTSEVKVPHTQGMRALAEGIEGPPTHFYYTRVPPGPCYPPAARSEQKPECANNRYRFVLPFEGKYKNTTPTATIAWSEISWKVCCGCGVRPADSITSGPPPSEPTEDEEDCFQTGRLNQKWFDSQFQEVKARLAELLPKFEHHYNETLFNLEAWRFINLACGITDIVIKVAEKVVGDAHDYADAILKGREFAENITSDSDTWIIPGGLGSLVDQFGKIVDAYKAHLGDQAVLRTRLQSCHMMKEAFPKAYEAARQFLHHRQQTHEYASRLRRLLQKLERLDIEYELETDKYHRQCVECANRQGKDPALCPGLHDN